MKKKNKQKTSFSKGLLIQESILIWIITMAFLILAFYCVFSGYTGELPFLSTMVGLPWTAYGASSIYYYKKATKENTSGGIVYDQALKNEQAEEVELEDDCIEE